MRAKDIDEPRNVDEMESRVPSSVYDVYTDIFI